MRARGYTLLYSGERIADRKDTLSHLGRMLNYPRGMYIPIRRRRPIAVQRADDGRADRRVSRYTDNIV